MEDRIDIYIRILYQEDNIVPYQEQGIHPHLGEDKTKAQCDGGCRAGIEIKIQIGAALPGGVQGYYKE